MTEPSDDQILALWDAAKAERPDLDDDALDALVQQRIESLGRGKKGKIKLAAAAEAAPMVPEVIPVDPRNPAFRERVIVAIVKSGGNVEAALTDIGISWEVYKQVTDHSDWDREVERIHHRMVVQPMLAAGKAAVVQKVIEEGSGYHLKMLYDTAPKEKLNEDDAAYLDSMSGAPRSILLREAKKLTAEVASLVESLEGGRRPSKQVTEQIVRDVSERSKQPKKAKKSA